MGNFMPTEIEKTFPHRKIDEKGLKARAEALKDMSESVKKKVDRINGQISDLTIMKKEIRYEWVEAVWRLGVIPGNVSEFKVLAVTKDGRNVGWSLKEPEFKEIDSDGK